MRGRGRSAPEPHRCLTDQVPLTDDEQRRLDLAIAENQVWNGRVSESAIALSLFGCCRAKQAGLR
jgi:hypothetical protein